MPDITALVQQTIQQQRLAESKEQDYVFRVDTNDIRLRKECTWAPQCPGMPAQGHPAGVGFEVVRYAEHHFEIFWLDGVRVARTLPSCDHCGTAQDERFIANIPVSETELAAENQRVDQAVAEAKDLRAQGKEASNPDNPPQILLSKVLELCSFSNPRRQMVEGRPTVLLDFTWNSSAAPVNAGEALLKPLVGTIGIDEEDHAIQHLEGRFLADVKWDEGKISIRKGTRITVSNRRVDPGIWLLSRLDVMGEGHYFSFAIDGAGHIFTGKYRRFRATATVLPDSRFEQNK